MPKIISDRRILAGNRFDVHALDLTGDDGRPYTREIIRHRGAVVLLPLLDDDHVVMIRNHRISIDQTLLELPAGTREAGEEAATTASRELIEETGYHAAKITHLHDFYSAPGICDELMHLFLATDLAAGDAAREATEQIDNQIVDRDQIIRWIADGSIRDAKTLIGLFFFLHHI